MTSPDSPQDAASALVAAAQAFDRAAEVRGSHSAAHELLSLQQDALQVLSAAWYRVAADAVARVESIRPVASDADAPSSGLSREQEVRLIAALHDVAAAFARCARACRDGESAAAPVIARLRSADPGDAARAEREQSWLAASRRHTERAVPA